MREKIWGVFITVYVASCLVLGIWQFTRQHTCGYCGQRYRCYAQQYVGLLSNGGFCSEECTRRYLINLIY